MFFLRVFFTVFFSYMALPVWAGLDAWTLENRMVGEKVTSIVADTKDSNTIYAGTASGVYKTTTGGSSWEIRNKGFATCINSSCSVQKLIIDNSGAIYAVYSGRIYKSVDQAATWQIAETGLLGYSSNQFSGLILDAKGVVYLTSGSGLYRSYDGGRNWAVVTNGLPSASISALTIDGLGNLIIGTSALGAFKSKDGGNSWVPMSTGLAPYVSNIFSDEAGNVFAASTSYSGSYSGYYIYSLPSSATNWIQVTNSFAERNVSFLSLNGVIYISTVSGSVSSLSASSDNGKSWKLVTKFNSPITALAGDSQGRLLIATSDGQMFGIKPGISYVITLNGLVGNSVTSIISSNNSIYAARNSEIYKSQDRGLTWILTSETPNYSSYSSYTQTVLYASPKGTLFMQGGVETSIRRSTDAGVTWSKPMQPNYFLGDSSSNSVVFGNDNKGNIFAGFSGYTNGLLMSSDDGATWSFVPYFINIRVYAIATDKQNNIYAATSTGVYTSTDGKTWKSSNLPAVTCRALTIDANDAIYAGFDAAGMFVSRDNGSSWLTANAGFSSAAISGLAFDKFSSTVFAVATKSNVGTLFKSDDGGKTWVNQNQTANVKSGSWMAVDNNGVRYMTSNNGLLQYTPIGTSPNDPFRVSASSNDKITELTLTALVSVHSKDAGIVGNFYVAAISPSGDLVLFNDGTGWRIFNPELIPAFKSGVTFNTNAINIFDGSMDVKAMSGMTIYVGYGRDAGEMISGQKYLPVYTLPPRSDLLISNSPLKLSWQGKHGLKVGEETNLVLSLQSDVNLRGLPAQFSFNPEQLDIVSVTDGGYFSKFGNSQFTFTVDKPSGRIAVALGRSTDGPGYGPLLNIRVRALVPGLSVIALTGIVPVGAASIARPPLPLNHLFVIE